MPAPVNLGIPPHIAQRLGLLNRGADVRMGLASQLVPTINWDFERDDTSEYYAYIGWGTCNAVAAQNPILQLFNPVGSGKTVFVDAVNAWKATAGEIDWYLMAGGITNLQRQGASTRGSINPSTGNVAFVPSSAQVRQQNIAGVIVAALQLGLHMQGGFTYQEPIKLEKAIRLDEGVGLLFEGVTVNESMLAQWWFREYPKDLAAE